MAAKKSKSSETTTENIFRDFYQAKTFIEKSAIPTEYGFVSKNDTSNQGYPDFFLDTEAYSMVVEAKAIYHNEAKEDILHYISKNKIKKDVVGIAVSGQSDEDLLVSIFLKEEYNQQIKVIHTGTQLLSIKNIDKLYRQSKQGETVTKEELTKTLKSLNRKFHQGNKVKDTERSLFFSGLMIALRDDTFRSTYRYIQPPSKSESSIQEGKLLESHNLNESVLSAITRQLNNKINNLSKQYSWRDRFSFIRNIDYSLMEYRDIISVIEDKIFKPFQNDEKHDILGRAYKIFLEKAGKVDNKNIILTPDHIKSLMIDLARLNVEDVVIDTCTGTGGFLMEAMERMISMANDNEEKIQNIKNQQLVGFEVDSVLFALACSNMFLHGDGRSNLIFRSSLLSDSSEHLIEEDGELLKHIKGYKPTKCIINPPYENNGSIKFALQALKYLEPNGRLIIIMPTPTLTKNQNGLTEKVLDIGKLDFVIRMPYKLFSEQKRTVNTSIFGFTKTKHNQDDEVIFYNLEDDGFVSIQHKGRVDKNQKWKSIKDEVISLILNSNTKDGLCTKKKIFSDGIINCAGIQEHSSDKVKMVRFSDLFSIEDGSLASENSEDGEFDFITASEEWKTHTCYEYDKEALVYAVSAGGSLGRSHYVNGKFIASNLCLVLTPKNNDEYPLNLRFYNAYLNKFRRKIESDLADGTSKLTINKNALMGYYIDFIPKDEQDKFVDEYIEKIDRTIARLREALEKQEKDISDSIDSLI